VDAQSVIYRLLQSSQFSKWPSQRKKILIELIGQLAKVVRNTNHVLRMSQLKRSGNTKRPGQGRAESPP
jgi:hypothetical protein